MRAMCDVFPSPSSHVITKMGRRKSFSQMNNQGTHARRAYRGRHHYERRDSALGRVNGYGATPQAVEPARGLSARVGHWIRALGHSVGRFFVHRDGGIEADALVIGGAGLGLGALLNGMDWENVRTDVERESRAHVILVGAEDGGKTTLVYRLKGLEEGAIEPLEVQDAFEDEAETLSPPEEMLKLENFGFFAVLDVAPGKPPNASLNGYFENGGVWNELESADLIVWVLDGARGLRAWEYEWISRVRGSGKALLVVANKLDRMKGMDSIARWQQALGVEIVPISAREGTNVMTQLVPRMADAIPSLATALGREVVEWRRTAAQRVMRRAATLSGLVGLEPVPLLDLPFQISIQLQMVMRLAAIYGQPLRDQYSREMLATMVSAVAIRFAGGQLVKAIPLVGWIASGALAAGGTWVIGRIALGYFEGGRAVRIPLVGRARDEKRETRSERGSDGEIEGEEKKMESGKRAIKERIRGWIAWRLRHDAPKEKDGGDNEREKV